MKELGILKLDELYNQQCVTLVHDATNNRVPLPIKEFLNKDSEESHYNLRNHHRDPNHVKTPFAKCKTSTSSFSYQGPLHWNKVPRELQDIKEKQLFKLRYKRYLLDKYSKTTNCNNPNCTDRRHHHLRTPL